MAYAVTAGYKTIAKSKAVFWKSKIHIVEDNVDISGNDYLQKWTLKNYTYDENDGTLIGNTIAKMLELQLINTSDYVLENKEIELYSGVVLNPTADESIWNIEYVPHGNFIIQPVENREVPAQQRFVAYDYMVKFNKQFSVGALTYPTTPLLLLQHICTLAGVTLATTSFTNDDFVITAGDAFVNYTCREVLSSICKVSGTTASINRDNELELLDFGATSVETIDGNHYITFEKNKIWGELNELTLNSYDIDGENVTENDATSISTYGLTPLNIQEQLIMYTQDLRTTAITDLWTKLFQIKYTPFKMKVKSFNYLDPLDKITIKDVNDNSYTTYVFNQTIIFDMGSMSNEIHTPALTLSQVQLKFIPTEKLINQRTEIIVNKHEGEITLLASSVENIELQRPFYRYSANADGSSMTESPQVSTRYLGTYVGTAASANYTDYTWTLIKGADGQDGADGLPGTPGADGITYYTWIRYSDNADGTDLYATPTENTLYIGIAYNKTSATPSSTKTDYTWSKFRGDTGTAGENGTDGTTYYTWIKYADDSSGTNLSDSPTGKAYIGLAHNKTTVTESTTPSDYTWALIKGADGNDGKSLWLAYCDEIDTYTGFSIDPEDSNKDYYGMYVGLTQSNTATDYEWYPSNYKLDGDIGDLDDYVRTTVEGRIDVEVGRIDAVVGRVDSLEDFVETVSTLDNYVKLTGTPVSNGAISNLSIKGFNLMGLYPGLSFPNQYTYPGALSMYTLVFDTVYTFNVTPKYVYINSPIPLQKIGSTYDEISIVNNQVSIIQRIGYSGTTPIVLSTPIVHDVGSVLLPTFDGNTYIKVLGFTGLIFASTYMQKNALTNVFATQLESSAVLSITTDRINSKVSKDGVISEINQSPEQIAISANKIALEGYTTINNGFSVDLDGNATMNNATMNDATIYGDIYIPNTESKVIGNLGIFGGLHISQKGLIGQEFASISGGYAFIQNVIKFVFYIPDTFTVSKAYIILKQTKTKHIPVMTDDVDGKLTTVNLYSGTTERTHIVSDYWDAQASALEYNDDTGTVITSAFNNYTAPNIYSNTVLSADISSSITTGINNLFINNGSVTELFEASSYPDPTSLINARLPKSCYAYADLIIYGYDKT